MSSTTIQVGIFIFITALIAFLTYLKCRAAVQSTDHSVEADNKEVFLAGGGLSWLFVAGSITLTNDYRIIRKALWRQAYSSRDQHSLLNG